MRTSLIPTLRRLAARALYAIPLLAAMTGAAAATDAPPSRMAQIDAYLMDRTAEIALARSAAPPSIAKDATVLVLTRTGYEAAVTGSNGFVCMVGRGFSGAPDWPERWDPRIRAAECQNPQAARTMAPIARLRTALTLAGESDADTLKRIKAALRTGTIPALEAGAMSYMMSRSSVLSEVGEHNMAHVMFFVPTSNDATWGANLPGSPVVGGSYWFLTPGHGAEAAGLPAISVYLVGVCSWSDGTAAPAHPM